MLLCNGVDTDDWKKPLVLTVDANITANCFVDQIDQLLVIRNTHKEMISTEIASQMIRMHQGIPELFQEIPIDCTAHLLCP